MLHMVNKYMDLYKKDRSNLSLKAKAEKHVKIIAKTIIFSVGESASNYRQNSFFMIRQKVCLLVLFSSLQNFVMLEKGI